VQYFKREAKKWFKYAVFIDDMNDKEQEMVRSNQEEDRSILSLN